MGETFRTQAQIMDRSSEKVSEQIKGISKEFQEQAKDMSSLADETALKSNSVGDRLQTSSGALETIAERVLLQVERAARDVAQIGAHGAALPSGQGLPGFHGAATKPLPAVTSSRRRTWSMWPPSFSKSASASVNSMGATSAGVGT